MQKLLRALPRIDKNQDFSFHFQIGDALAQKPDLLPFLQWNQLTKSDSHVLNSLLDVRVRFSRPSHRHAHRRRHPIERQIHDARRKRRGKQKQLAIRANHVEQRANLLLEPQRNHAIGLVQDDVRAPIHRQVLLIHQIDEPSGRADDEVKASHVERFLLLPLALSAGDAHHGETERSEERLRDAGDLLGELARGNHRDSDGPVRLLQLSKTQRGGEGLRLRGGVQNERPEIAAGLAAAGGAAADDVAARENEGQSGGLDGRGAEEALRLDGAAQGGGEGEGGEGKHGLGRFGGERGVRSEVVDLDAVLRFPGGERFRGFRGIFWGFWRGRRIRIRIEVFL